MNLQWHEEDNEGSQKKRASMRAKTINKMSKYV